MVCGYHREQPLGGTLKVESDSPLIVRPIAPEGTGFNKRVFEGEWDFKNSGGCSNFGSFEKNPAYVV